MFVVVVYPVSSSYSTLLYDSYCVILYAYSTKFIIPVTCEHLTSFPGI